MSLQNRKIHQVNAKCNNNNNNIIIITLSSSAPNNINNNSRNDNNNRNGSVLPAGGAWVAFRGEQVEIGIREERK